MKTQVQERNAEQELFNISKYIKFKIIYALNSTGCLDCITTASVRFMIKGLWF